MSSEAEVVYVAWCASRADTIRDALRSQGDEARVIALSGSLNYGPINPRIQMFAKAWIRAVLRPDAYDDQRETETPRMKATSGAVHPVCSQQKIDSLQE